MPAADMADSTPKSYATDPTLYLYTSLTAGSSHIITATSRLETILKANRIPFRAIDVATDEKARMLWGRRSKGRTLPGLVKFGNIVGDMDQIEEWNEYGELKMQIRALSSMATGAPPAIGSSIGNAPGMRTASSVTTPAPTPSPTPSATKHIQIQDPLEKPSASTDKDGNPITLALRQAGADAASKARENTKTKLAPAATKTEGKKTEEKEGEKNEGKKEDEKTEVSAEEARKTEVKEEEKNEEEKEDEKEKEEKESPPTNSDISPSLDLPPTTESASTDASNPERPGLRKDSAVESSLNIHAENVNLLGMSGHYRTSGVSATSKEERESVAYDRASLQKDVADIKDKAEGGRKAGGEDGGVVDGDEESGEGVEDKTVAKAENTSETKVGEDDKTDTDGKDAESKKD